MINRYRSFDTLKGICIIAVVLCHTVYFEMIYPRIFGRWLQIVFLNVFYFTAGWVYASQSIGRKDSTRKIVMSKVLQLGFPYIMLCLLSTAFDAILVCVFNNTFISDTYAGSQIILRDLFCFFSLNGVGTLWFLPVLLVAMIVIILFHEIMRNKKERLIFGLLISIIGYLLYLGVCNLSFTPTNIILDIVSKECIFLQRIFTAISYVFLGYFFQGIERRHMCSPNKKILFGGLILLLWIIDYFTYGIFDSLAVIGITILFFGIEQKSGNKYQCRFLEYCGKNSLLIMVLHYNLLLPIIMQVCYSFECMNDFSVIIQRSIIFVLDFVLTILLVEIVNWRENIAFVFGKGQKFLKTRKILLRD